MIAMIPPKSSPLNNFRGALKVLKDFPQYRVDLYRDILSNAIRPNELKRLGWLSVSKECAQYVVDILCTF
jgi:hypothetical protein